MVVLPSSTVGACSMYVIYLHVGTNLQIAYTNNELIIIDTVIELYKIRDGITICGTIDR